MVEVLGLVLGQLLGKPGVLVAAAEQIPLAETETLQQQLQAKEITAELAVEVLVVAVAEHLKLEIQALMDMAETARRLLYLVHQLLMAAAVVVQLIQMSGLVELEVVVTEERLLLL